MVRFPLTSIRHSRSALLTAAATIFVSPFAHAQEAPENRAPRYAIQVESCYRDWLKAENKVDGFNKMPNGSVLLVAYGQATVNADKQDAEKWLNARSAAFIEAELGARENIATTLRAELASGSRMLDALQAGGDSLPPALTKAVKQMSVADKALVLTGAELDARIKEFKPEWDGTGHSEEERKQEAIKIQTRIRDRIAQHARAFISGAFTPLQCEGPDSDGKYSVITGAIWSPKLAQIAESIVNPTYAVPPGKPELSLDQRFAELSKDKPDWMAMTQGVRVWTDETGNRVVVGFGTVPATSQAGMDAARARTRALAAIQRFKAEQIAGANNDDFDFSYRETASTTQALNTSEYRRKIEAIAPEMTLEGAQSLFPWRLNHPYSNGRLTTVAVKWSPDGREAARATTEQMRKALQPAGHVDAPVPRDGAVRSGATSSTDDF